MTTETKTVPLARTINHMPNWTPWERAFFSVRPEMAPMVERIRRIGWTRFGVYLRTLQYWDGRYREIEMGVNLPWKKA